MNIEVNNQAGIPRKHIRFLKWRVYRISRKFNYLLYAKIHIRQEGSSTTKYLATIILGVPGSDIIIKKESQKLKELWSISIKSAQRHLRKYKEMKVAA